MTAHSSVTAILACIENRGLNYQGTCDGYNGEIWLRPLPPETLGLYFRISAVTNGIAINLLRLRGYDQQGGDPEKNLGSGIEPAREYIQAFIDKQLPKKLGLE